MAYTIIGADLVQEKEVIQQNVFPTIFIGLGGTGKEILMRVRRRFVDRFGDLQDFPLVAYRIIDTDHAHHITGEVIEADPFYDLIKFKDTELIQTNVSVAQYYDKLHFFPHIKSWLVEHGTIRKLGDLGKGAGQIRVAARLAFFHSFNQIVNSLNDAKSQVKGEDVSKKMEEFGLTIDSSATYVYIINSLAGGTGSGIFLDLAFLIKQSFPNTTIIGILLLPNVFRGVLKEDRPYANGYASLKELEHYQLSNHFNVNWAGNRELKIPPPPFDYTYIIDGSNFSGMEINNQQYIYEIIADNLFMEFSRGDFAARRRSVRINKIGYMQNLFVFKHKNQKGEETMPEMFSCRYSSFGISAIAYPADRIINACACKFASKLVDYWGANYAGDIDLRNYLFQKFLFKLQLLEGETTIEGERVRKSDFITTLYKYDSVTGKTFEGLIFENADRLKNNIENKLHESEGKTISQYLRAQIAQFEALWNESEDNDQWGEYVRIVNQRKADLYKDACQKIEVEARSLANKEAYGVAFVTALLEELKKVLYEETLDYKPRFQREESEIARAIPTASGELEEVVIRIARVEKRFWDPLKNTTVKHLVEDVFTDAFQRYFVLRLKRLARELAAKLCDDLVKFLGYRGKDRNKGLIGQLNELQITLQQLRYEFDRKYEYYKERKENDILIQLYDPQDVDNKFYPAIVGKDNQEKELIKQHSIQLMGQLGKRNVDELIGTSTRWEVLQSRVIAYTRRLFMKITEDFDVLEMLYETGDAEAKGKIERLFYNGKAWIYGADVAYAFKLREGQKTLYIGLNMKNVDKFNKFNRDLFNILKGDKVQFFQSVNNSEVVLYNEINGFVLSYLQSINQPNGYRERYIKERNIDDECELHTDKNSYRFNDIVMLDEKDRLRLEESQRAFLLGTILGIIKVEEERIDHETTEYIYKAERWVVKPITKESKVLGIEQRAMIELYEDTSTPPWRRSINEEINEKREELKLRGLLAEYAVVLKYYFEQVYKMTEIEVAGRAKQKKSSVEHDVLVEEFQVVSEELIAESERQKFSQYFKENEPRISSYTVALGDKGKRALNWATLGGSYSGRAMHEISSDTKICPVCLKEIKEKARRCKFCKSDLEQCQGCKTWLNKGTLCPNCAIEKCPYCDEVIMKGEKLCPHCGADLTVAPEEEPPKAITQTNPESENIIEYINCPVCDERIHDNVTICPECKVQIK